MQRILAENESLVRLRTHTRRCQAWPKATHLASATLRCRLPPCLQSQWPRIACVQKLRVAELEAQLKQQQAPPALGFDGAEVERLRAVLRAVQAMVSLPGV
jgi:hypothetical protein